MVLRSILGHPVFLDRRQENALRLADMISKELAAQRRQEDERLLQSHLQRMEERCRIYPTAEEWKKAARQEYLKSCAPKHHAWEYTDFTFFHEGKEYLYNNGDILDTEVFQWEEELVL